MAGLNLEKLKQRLEEEENKSNGASVEYDKLTQGKNTRRILFPKGTNDEFYSEGYIHYNVGGKGVVTCRKTFGYNERCPICEYVNNLRESANPEDQNLYQKMRAKKRIYINVLDRDKGEDKPKVLGIGQSIFKALLGVFCDPDYGDITDPDKGRDVMITRSGQGINTTYSLLVKPNTSPVSLTVSKEELDTGMADLKSLFLNKSYDELLAILNGTDSNSQATETTNTIGEINEGFKPIGDEELPFKTDDEDDTISEISRILATKNRE